MMRSFMISTSYQMLLGEIRDDDDDDDDMNVVCGTYEGGERHI